MYIYTHTHTHTHTHTQSQGRIQVLWGLKLIKFLGSLSKKQNIKLPLQNWVRKWIII